MQKGWILALLSMQMLVMAQSDTQAFDTETVTNAFSEIVQLSTFVDANVEFCEARALSAVAVQEAANTWYAANELDVLTSLRGLSELGTQLSSLENDLKMAVIDDLSSRAVGREAEWCATFPELLQSPEWQVQNGYAAELDLLREFVTSLTQGGEVTQGTASPQAQALAPVINPSYAEVLAAGIDPNRQFIPTEFRCYQEDSLDYSQPHFVVQISAAGQYESSYGGGSFALKDSHRPDIEWLSGPLTGAEGSLSFSEFGQMFSLDDLEVSGERFDLGCYQQGASEERALTSFRLKEPQLGSYQCRDAETGEVQSLELLANNQYQIGDTTGEYRVSDLLNLGSSSSIDWLTGPFAEESSRYSEEEGNGFRTFSLSVSTGGAGYPGFVYSSSELALVCEGVGEPISFARYGDETALPAPGTELPLDGLYYLYSLTYEGTTPTYKASFYRFFPDGYVFVGTPEAGDISQIDCSRSLPNGTPFCATYNVQADTLYIKDTSGMQEFSFALDGELPVLDGEVLTPVSANTRTNLDGLYWSNSYSQSGLCGGFSTCSSSYREWYYAFEPDGSFVYTTSSQNLSSMDTALGSSSASGYGNSANTGSYEIGPHSVELRYDNGQVESHFMFVQDAERFVMGDKQFSPKEEE